LRYLRPGCPACVRRRTAVLYTGVPVLGSGLEPPRHSANPGGRRPSAAQPSVRKRARPGLGRLARRSTCHLACVAIGQPPRFRRPRHRWRRLGPPRTRSRLPAGIGADRQLGTKRNAIPARTPRPAARSSHRLRGMISWPGDRPLPSTPRSPDGNHDLLRDVRPLAVTTRGVQPSAKVGLSSR